MAGSNSLRSKGRIQMRETSHLQITTSSLQHTAGSYRCAISRLMHRSKKSYFVAVACSQKSKRPVARAACAGNVGPIGSRPISVVDVEIVLEVLRRLLVGAVFHHVKLTVLVVDHRAGLDLTSALLHSSFVLRATHLDIGFVNTLWMNVDRL